MLKDYRLYKWQQLKSNYYTRIMLIVLCLCISRTDNPSQLLFPGKNSEFVYEERGKET
jgi:VanZ family protein